MKTYEENGRAWNSRCRGVCIGHGDVDAANIAVDAGGLANTTVRRAMVLEQQGDIPTDSS